MFTKLSLALTLLLGSALAVLTQSYVDQMTPRGKHRRLGYATRLVRQPVRRSRCRTERAVSNMRDERWPGSHAALRRRRQLMQAVVELGAANART
jgi:hypothetical protein